MAPPAVFDTDLDTLRPDIVAADERGVAIRTLLTGDGVLECGQVAYHPPLESELQGITATLLVDADDREFINAVVWLGSVPEFPLTPVRHPSVGGCREIGGSQQRTRANEWRGQGYPSGQPRGAVEWTNDFLRTNCDFERPCYL